MEARIDILLSTYNGAKYLAALLDSVIRQTNTNWRLLVRDDGSTDGTVTILEDYIHRFPDKITWLSDSTKVGVIRSFEQLLASSEADYYMFADQDDVWKDDKVEISLAAIRQLEEKYPNQAAVCYTNLELVDENMQPLHTTFWHYNRLKMPMANRWIWTCVGNPMAGCTCIMNNLAKSAVLPFPSCVPMHDWWIIAKVGKIGVVDYVPQTTILYRQHADNTCGVSHPTWRYYARIIKSPSAKWQEFKALEPFLQTIGFGSAAKYMVYKVVYALIRRL